MKKKSSKSKALEVPYKPESTLYLTEKELPAIKDWEVGEKYKLYVNTELTSLSKDNFNGDKKYEARFKIIKIIDK